MEDYTKIYDMPPVPKGIIEAVNRAEFAVFIGAGVSCLAGCISWQDLALRLVDKCYSLNDGDALAGKLNFRQKERLKKDTDYKKTITIIKEVFSERGTSEQFDQAVYNLLNEDSGVVEYPKIYDELRGIRGLFLTTNVDAKFDKSFGNRIAHREEDFGYDKPDRDKLYHIHGSIKEPKGIVLTLEQYFERYKEGSKLHKFLETIFQTFCILFIGYGLSEFEILDYLFTKLARGGGRRHYVLLPYFEGEDNCLKLDQYYYNTMHITAVAYKADDKGHGRLGDVIKEWANQIKLQSMDLVRRYAEIDDIVEKVEHD
jgi:hypothetical protein